MTAVADPRRRLDRVASGQVYLSDDALMGTSHGRKHRPCRPHLDFSMTHPIMTLRSNQIGAVASVEGHRGELPAAYDLHVKEHGDDCTL